MRARATRALLAGTILAAVTAPVVLVNPQAGSAASSIPRETVKAKIEFTVRDITPPEDVGRRPVIAVTGRVVTKNKKVHRGCRADRTPEIVVGPHGPANPDGFVFDLHPTTKKGKFKGNFPLDYGGYSEGGLLTGQVDFAGGAVPFRAQVPKLKTTVPGGGPFGTLANCRFATSVTKTLNIPPSPAE